MDANNFYSTNTAAILTYHSLDDNRSVISTSPRSFAEHMRMLSELDADIVGIKEIKEQVTRGNTSRPMVAITFDDGFDNFYEHGFPILQKYGFPATVFLVTDYCGRSNAWPSQPAGIPIQPLLSWKQIKTMSDAGISFGSHTRTHPNLKSIAIGDVENELVGSKKAIENIIGQSVDAFAYPYGSFHDGIKELAKAHFALACSTSLGFVLPKTDLFALERLDMYYMRGRNGLRKLFSLGMQRYIQARRLMRDIKGYLEAPLRKIESETSG